MSVRQIFFLSKCNSEIDWSVYPLLHNLAKTVNFPEIQVEISCEENLPEVWRKRAFMYSNVWRVIHQTIVEQDTTSVNDNFKTQTLYFYTLTHIFAMSWTLFKKVIYYKWTALLRAIKVDYCLLAYALYQNQWAKKAQGLYNK